MDLLSHHFRKAVDHIGSGDLYRASVYTLHIRRSIVRSPSDFPKARRLLDQIEGRISQMLAAAAAHEERRHASETPRDETAPHGAP